LLTPGPEIESKTCGAHASVVSLLHLGTNHDRRRPTVGGQAQRPQTTPPTRNEIMNALTHWNQLKELEALRHGLGSLFSRSPVHLPEGQEEQIAVPEWAPLVDISEDDQEYRIKIGRAHV